jgi:hypothetical protein
MILTVKDVTTTEHEDKDTDYKVVLKGNDASGCEVTVSLKDTSQNNIKKYVPMIVGEQRNVEFELVNRTLDEFAQEEDEEMKQYD